MRKLTSIILLVVVAAGAASQALAAGSAAPSLRLQVDRLPAPLPLDLAQIIIDAAAHHHLDPNLLASVAYKESRFRPQATSSRGARGIMQLMPRTARALGVTDSYDSRQNVFAGAKYLRKMLDTFGGDLDLALSAYNAGPERVKREGVTPTAESADYVSHIKRLYEVARSGA